MAQFARPATDVTTNTWAPSTGTTLFGVLDEPTPNDSDFVENDNNSNDACEVALAAVSDPGSASGHVVRYRYRKSAASGNARNLTVVLVQGTTVIASQTHTDIGATETDGSFTLTGTEAASISDYSDLRLRFTASGTTGGPGGNRRAVRVTWAELEVPDAAPSVVELASVSRATVARAFGAALLSTLALAGTARATPARALTTSLTLVYPVSDSRTTPARGLGQLTAALDLAGAGRAAPARGTAQLTGSLDLAGAGRVTPARGLGQLTIDAGGGGETIVPLAGTGRATPARALGAALVSALELTGTARSTPARGRGSLLQAIALLGTARATPGRGTGVLAVTIAGTPLGWDLGETIGGGRWALPIAAGTRWQLEIRGGRRWSVPVRSETS